MCMFVFVFELYLKKELVSSKSKSVLHLTHMYVITCAIIFGLYLNSRSAAPVYLVYCIICLQSVVLISTFKQNISAVSPF